MQRAMGIDAKGIDVRAASTYTAERLTGVSTNTGKKMIFFVCVFVFRLFLILHRTGHEYIG